MQERTLNGWAVKALREALEIPASTFATECLMSPGQLSSIETGRKTASDQAKRRIITALEREWSQRQQHHRSRALDLELALTFPAVEAATA